MGTPSIVALNRMIVHLLLLLFASLHLYIRKFNALSRKLFRVLSLINNTKCYVLYKYYEFEIAYSADTPDEPQ